MYLLFLYFFFTWLALQNLLLPLAYRQEWLSFAAVSALMASKEVVMVLALLLLGYRAFQKGWRFNTADKFALGYAILLVLYLVFGPSFFRSTVPLFIRAVSLRALISLVVFYFWGRLSFFELDQLRNLTRFVLGLQIVVAIFGIFEWSVLPLSFWRDTVGSGLFMLDIKGLQDGWNVFDGLPGNMVRSDIRRSISTYGDPLAMGIACVFPLLLCVAWLFNKKSTEDQKAAPWKWWIALAVIGVALLATNGRESIGVTLLGVAILAWRARKIRYLIIPAAITSVALLMIPDVWKHVVDTITFREGSASYHLDYLHSGWQRVPKLMMGEGLGESGTWALSLTGVQTDVGESSYLELMAQTGFLSVLFLVGFLVAMTKTSLWYSRRIPDRLLSAAFAAMAANIVGRSVFAVFSPSLFGVVPMASFVFLCGAGFTTMQRVGLRPGFVFRKAVLLRRIGEGSKAEGLSSATPAEQY